MIKLDAIELPDNLFWINEFDYAPVQQTQQRTLDGNVLIYYAGLTKGRPIYLQSTSDACWVSKATLDALQAKANEPGLIMTLQMRNINYSVMFKHDEAPALAAVPVVSRPNPELDDYFMITLKLTEV